MPKMQVSVVRETFMNPADLQLQEIRHAIDGVDSAIATLLASRLKLSRLAIMTKVQEGLPVVDLLREAEIQRNYERVARGASPVARAILRWCRGTNEH